MATLLTAPADTIKTKRQLRPAEYSSLFRSASLIASRKGFVGFFEGAALRMAEVMCVPMVPVAPKMRIFLVGLAAMTATEVVFFVLTASRFVQQQLRKWPGVRRRPRRRRPVLHKG